MSSFYHIFLQPKAGISEQQISEKMNLAVDWYRYSEYCWIVKTTSTASKWNTRLKPFVEPGGNLLIVKLDPSERQGWMAKSFWSWLKESGAKKA